MTNSQRALVLAALLAPWLAVDALARSTCPATKFLPQLTIDNSPESAIPVVDTWQVLLDGIPVSDAQLALLAGQTQFIEETSVEIRRRGTWVYIGMLTAAFGTAASSAGWVLYGRDELSQSITLPIALVGLAIGMAGVLLVTESIQTPLEPYLTPTPRHRLSRDEAQRLIYAVNRRWHERLCDEVDAIIQGYRLAPAGFPMAVAPQPAYGPQP